MKTRNNRVPAAMVLLVLTLCLFLIACAGMGTLPAPAMPMPAASAPLVAAASEPASGTSYQGPFGFGRDATAEEITAWDIDVRPDGTGLPAGRGTVAEGAQIFAETCAACHGVDGKTGPYSGGPLGVVLVGPYDPDASWPQTPKTIGNFWPYAPTLFDYIQRAQPYDAPGSLAPDQVYALVAWLLYQNGLIAEDAVMDATTLPQVRMPAYEKFVDHDVRDTSPFP